MNTKTKEVEVKALDARVLAVAVEGEVGDWAAYIGAVKGWNHNKEWQEVRDNGSKMSEEAASLIFPEFAKKFRWRR